jgi:hypothetical protein
MFNSINKNLFIKPAIKNPRKPPIKSEGAKIPPLPPDEIVMPVANILTNNKTKMAVKLVVASTGNMVLFRI